MNADIGSFLKNPWRLASGLDDTIDPRDEMYLGSRELVGAGRARMLYLKLGKHLSLTISQIVDWRFPNRKSSIKILEFACGYGRNVRHLIHKFPVANLFVSDIYADAVAFNQQRFGVAGRTSVHDPKDLTWAERFDLIVVPSLFTHLPEATFANWIAALFRLLTDDGLLVFSVHGEHLMGRGIPMPPSGIHFLAESESATLDKQEYGTTVVTEGFVREQILRATGRDAYSMTRRGFWNHHDAYMVSKDDHIDFSTFHYDYGIPSAVDHIMLDESGMLRIVGWAKDTHQDDNADLSIQVFIDGHEVAATRSFHPREDVAHFWGEGFVRTGYQIDVRGQHRLDSTLVIAACSSARIECLHALRLDASLTQNRLPRWKQALHRSAAGRRILSLIS